ncbi:MAG: zf-HC2 domain-containing protein [Candidatus Omnitrophica bacterium]|nr:zf-HC2 domain-containing protein [Candidatus Omnitrophota bacterium]
MNCEQVQEIILTEYLDKCLTGPVKVQCEAHVENCSDCQAFLSIASKRVITPFLDLPRERMPESVANAIMLRVFPKAPERKCTWVDVAIEQMRSWYAPVLPTTGWAMAILVCFIIVGTQFNINGSEEVKQTERVLYMAEVADFSSVKGGIMRDSGERKYGTSMETYFLDDKEES